MALMAAKASESSCKRFNFQPKNPQASGLGIFFDNLKENALGIRILVLRFILRIRILKIDWESGLTNEGYAERYRADSKSVAGNCVAGHFR